MANGLLCALPVKNSAPLLGTAGPLLAYYVRLFSAEAVRHFFRVLSTLARVDSRPQLLKRAPCDVLFLRPVRSVKRHIDALTLQHLCHFPYIVRVVPV